MWHAATDSQLSWPSIDANPYALRMCHTKDNQLDTRTINIEPASGLPTSAIEHTAANLIGYLEYTVNFDCHPKDTASWVNNTKDRSNQDRASQERKRTDRTRKDRKRMGRASQDRPRKDRNASVAAVRITRPGRGRARSSLSQGNLKISKWSFN